MIKGRELTNKQFCWISHELSCISRTFDGSSEGRGGWGEGGLGLGVRIVMEYLEVTTNYVHVGQQHDRNNQLVVHYSTTIPYQVNTKCLVERKYILIIPSI